jgi:hypothetical protein
MGNAAARWRCAAKTAWRGRFPASALAAAAFLLLPLLLFLLDLFYFLFFLDSLGRFFLGGFLGILAFAH